MATGQRQSIYCAWSQPARLREGSAPPGILWGAGANCCLPPPNSFCLGGGWGDLNPQPLLKSQLRFQCGMALHSHHLEVLCGRGQMLPPCSV